MAKKQKVASPASLVEKQIVQAGNGDLSELDERVIRTHDVLEVTDEIHFADWEFYIGMMGEDGHYLQCRFRADDAETGEEEWQHSRKWYISSHATKSEIVQTALKAVLAAVEHEVREQFLYKGRPIFGPHYNVDSLHTMSEDPEYLEVRK